MALSADEEARGALSAAADALTNLPELGQPQAREILVLKLTTAAEALRSGKAALVRALSTQGSVGAVDPALQLVAESRAQTAQAPSVDAPLYQISNGCGGEWYNPANGDSEEAQGTIAADAARTVREADREGRARSESGGRCGGGSADEAASKENGRRKTGDLTLVFRYVSRRDLWWCVKDFVQSIKATYFSNGLTRRPPFPTLNRPDPSHNIEPGVGPSKADLQGTLLHVMTKNHESDVSNREGRPKEEGSAIDLGFNFVTGVGIRNDHLRDSLLARLSEWLAPRTYVVRYWAQGEPNHVTMRWLFCGVEAFIFRVWYDFAGRVNLLKHECGFDRPRRK